MTWGGSSVTDASIAALSEQLITELAKPIDPRTVPVRFSALKQMALSPAHYRQAVQFERPDSLPLRIGRGVHSFLLDMPDRVIEWTGKTRNGKVWDAFKAEHESAGKEILNRAEYERSVAIARSIRSNPEAMRLLFGGTTMETRIDWTFMGRACRSTPDAYNQSWIVELKTCRTANPDLFVRAATYMGYPGQLAFYMQALATAELARIEEAYIVAVESVPPHVVQIFRMTPRALAFGEAAYRGWFERLLGCEAVNEWPGYCQVTVDFDVLESQELVYGDEPATDEAA